MTRFRCPNCGYVYDETRGCPREGLAPGTRWAQVPDAWACPDCAVREKVDFQPEDASMRGASSDAPGDALSV